ncbi:MAG: hypothetical protein DRI61_16725 [Chloroflexi bacterium]|nr:MAG: hypothetical protein DRI61_16725 [Chloroflexota bacterium]HDN79808.1 TetR/AcrR family transcriptional regulator [Chloroflexota bacterium]
MATAERRAREKEQRRQEILDAARKVFFFKGIHSATVEDVAAEAELGKGTIYLYFSSKEEILAHLLLEGFDLLIEQLEEASSDEATTPSERIRHLAYAYLHFFQEYPGYFRLMVAFDRGRLQEKLPSELCEEIKVRNREALSWVSKAIEEGIEKGYFRPGDPWLIAGALWASIHGILLVMSIPFRREILGFTLEEMVETALQTLLKGLESPQATT